MTASANQRKNAEKLDGRGESSTLRLYWFVTRRLMAESPLFYILLGVGSLFIGWLTFVSTKEDASNYLTLVLKLVDSLINFYVFVPAFVFVVLAMFPYFSQGLRKRLKLGSRSTSDKIVQNTLNQFAFIMIWSLFCLLLCLLLKGFCQFNDQLGFLKPHSSRWSSVYAVQATLIVFFSCSVSVEILRSVRTIYILVLADYLEHNVDSEEQDDPTPPSGPID